MKQISVNELKRKYYGLKNKQLCEELGISIPTLIKLVDDAGIQRKGKGSHKKYKVVF